MSKRKEISKQNALRAAEIMTGMVRTIEELVVNRAKLHISQQLQDDSSDLHDRGLLCGYRMALDMLYDLPVGTLNENRDARKRAGLVPDSVTVRIQHIMAEQEAANAKTEAARA